jgi:uncharacterized protein YceH (UPF0502 family)
MTMVKAPGPLVVKLQRGKGERYGKYIYSVTNNKEGK